MKISLLGCLLLICLMPLSQAQDSAKPKSDQVVTQNSPANEDYFFKIRPERAPEADETYCAYIRAYRVKRKFWNSDEVIPAGYTTCIPSKQFEFRSAVETQTESTGDK